MFLFLLYVSLKCTLSFLMNINRNLHVLANVLTIFPIILQHVMQNAQFTMYEVSPKASMTEFAEGKLKNSKVTQVSLSEWDRSGVFFFFFFLSFFFF